MKSSKKNVRPVSFRPRTVFLFLTLLTATAVCQETTLRSQSNLVLVPALVKDPQGNVVYGLEAKDFLIDDNGIEQSVHLDEAPEGQPVSLVIAIQTGRRAAYEFPRMRGLKTMLDPLFSPGTARLALVEFDSKVQLIRKFSVDDDAIDAALTDVRPGDDGAAILDAIGYSIGLLKKEPEGRLRVLLLISETRDHGSKVKIGDAVAAIGQSNSLMYALAFSPGLSNILDTGRGNNKPGTDMNEMHPGVNFLDLAYRAAQAMRKNVPSTVASMTGGEYELFTTRKRFDVRMTDFTNHLHSRYLLSFTSRSPHPGLHEIRVRLKDSKENTIVARTSYWAESTE